MIKAVCFLWLVLSLSCLNRAWAEEKWPGIDETVVKKIAREHGRQGGESLINLEGDLQLFAFLTAGTIGGFVAGYYWRVLLEGKRKREEEP